MRDYILNRDENGMVRYLYGKDKRYPYVGKTKWESARWMLENDKTRELRMSEEYEGFPLTADGVYFFDGAVAVGESKGETTSSGTEARGEGVRTSSDPGEAGATFPIGEGSGETDEAAPVCGPDWCEIPEVAENETVGEMIPAGVNAYVVKVADIGAEKPKRRKRVKDVVCE